MLAPHHQSPATHQDDPTDRPLEVQFDITVVDGAEGKRLSALQAKAILDVLTWWYEHASDLGQRIPPSGRRAD
jgi:hypothetical protein